MPSVTQILAATHANYTRVITDAVGQVNALVHQMERKKRIRHGVRGDQLTWPVRTSNPATSGWAGSDELSFAVKENESLAQLPWRGYAVSYGLLWTEMEMNKGNTQALFNMARERAEQAKQSMLIKLNGGMWQDGTAAGEKGIHGLQSFVSQSKTYAGIDQSSNSWWQAQSATATSFGTDWYKEIADLLISCTHAQGKESQPDIALCDTTTWGVLANILMGKQQFHDSPEWRDAGFKNFVINGVPFVWDPDAVANTIYFVNTNDLELCTVYDGGLLESRSAKSESPIGMLYSTVFFGNLKCRNPRNQGVLSGTNT